MSIEQVRAMTMEAAMASKQLGSVVNGMQRLPDLREIDRFRRIQQAIKRYDEAFENARKETERIEQGLGKPLQELKHKTAQAQKAADVAKKTADKAQETIKTVQKTASDTAKNIRKEIKAVDVLANKSKSAIDAFGKVMFKERLVGKGGRVADLALGTFSQAATAGIIIYGAKTAEYVQEIQSDIDSRVQADLTSQMNLISQQHGRINAVEKRVEGVSAGLDVTNAYVAQINQRTYTAQTQANTAAQQANAAITQANTATQQANAAITQANTATQQANAILPQLQLKQAVQQQTIYEEVEKKLKYALKPFPIGEATTPIYEDEFQDTVNQLQRQIEQVAVATATQAKKEITKIIVDTKTALDSAKKAEAKVAKLEEKNTAFGKVIDAVQESVKSVESGIKEVGKVSSEAVKTAKEAIKTANESNEETKRWGVTVRSFEPRLATVTQATITLATGLATVTQATSKGQYSSGDDVIIVTRDYAKAKDKLGISSTSPDAKGPIEKLADSNAATSLELAQIKQDVKQLKKLDEAIVGDITRTNNRITDLQKDNFRQGEMNKEGNEKLDKILTALPIIPALVAKELTPKIPTVPQIEQATSAAICNSTKGGCLSNALDGNAAKINNNTNNNTNRLSDLLGAGNAAANAGQLKMLQEITDKLGPQIEGSKVGLSGYFQKFAKWQQLDRILSVLTWVNTIHNAYMLSNSLADTLFSTADNVAKIFGFDVDGKEIDTKKFFGGLVDDFAKSVFGVENWKEMQETWKKWNRIYQAAANIADKVRSMVDSLRNVIEFVAENTGKIGNALKKFGAIGEKAFNWMPEQVNAQSVWITRLNNLENAASGIEMVTSEVLSIQQNVKEIKEQSDEFKKSIEDLPPKERSDNKPIKDKVEKDKQASKGQEITGEDKEADEDKE